jgi:pantoate--beta-alanine ligase
MKAIHTLKTRQEVEQSLRNARENGKSVGFVPTMGALHGGHISLVKRAASENEVVVVSIFVNPTQFNDPNDLVNYPRTPEKDLALLETAGVDYVFMPTESEIYPQPDTRLFNFGQLDRVMEGAHRPGHFNGVAQVVSRLFDIVKPNRAYFGQKDYQQLVIIRQLVKMLGLSIDIIACPIVREADGLAMSSRNLLLSPECRASAPLIHRTLVEACNQIGQMSVKGMISWVESRVNQDKNLRVEYFEISNAETLEPVGSWTDAKNIIGCIAVWAGKVRLIDNVILKHSTKG